MQTSTSPASVPSLPQLDPYLSVKEVVADSGLARTTIYERIRKGSFPPFDDLGGGRIGIPLSRYLAWKESRPTVSYAPQAA